MIETRLIKKAIFFLAIIFLFYISYVLKNFQLLLISTCFLFLFGFLFKEVNKNFLTFVFSILLAITIIEIFLFFKNNNKIIITKNNSNIVKDIKYEKSFLGYKPISGKQHHKIISNNSTILDAHYTIGDKGFRLTPQKNNLNKEKVFNFFGGSFVFGEWKINNYGVSGYGIHQMLAQIEKEAVNGDINILITHVPHIPRATCKRDYSFGTPKYILKKGKVIRSGFCNYGYLNFLPIPRIVGSIINRSQIKILFNKILYRKNDIDKNGIELYLAMIKKINHIINNNNKKFFLGYINNQSEIDKFILKNLNKNNINIIDLSLVESDKTYKLTDGHPNKEANKKRAEIIWDYLKNTSL
jgi:hypothetical protein